MRETCLLVQPVLDVNAPIARCLQAIPELELIAVTPEACRAEQVLHAGLAVVDQRALTPTLTGWLQARSQLHFATSLIIREGCALPFESALAHQGFALAEGALRQWLEDVQARRGDLLVATDQLVGPWQSGLLSHLKTDHFQQQVAPLLAHDWIRQLAQQGADALADYVAGLEAPLSLSLAEKLDLFLTLRAEGCYAQMLTLYGLFDPIEQALDLFREQHLFAANRLARTIEDKLALLPALEAIRRPSAETWALKGRVYKDCWQLAISAGETASAYLDRAIEAYRLGAHRDIRDAFPAINLATLLRLRGGESDLFEMRKVLNHLEYSLLVTTDALDALKGGDFSAGQPRRHADYWDTATVFEMAVLNSRFEEAMRLIDVLIERHTERWMLATTLNNLDLLLQHSEPQFSRYLAPVYYTLKGKAENIP